MSKLWCLRIWCDMSKLRRNMSVRLHLFIWNLDAYFEWNDWSRRPNRVQYVGCPCVTEIPAKYVRSVITWWNWNSPISKLNSNPASFMCMNEHYAIWWMDGWIAKGIVIVRGNLIIYFFCNCRMFQFQSFCTTISIWLRIPLLWLSGKFWSYFVSN